MKPSIQRNTLFRLVVLLSLALLASSCWADVIYTNFGPGNTYGGTYWPVGGASGQTIAASFVPTLSYDLGSVSVAVQYSKGVDGLNSIIVAADAGDAPGAVIESFNNLLFPVSPDIETVNSVLNPLLLAGQKYWIVMTTTASTEMWFFNDSSQTGLAYGNTGQATWGWDDTDSTPAFQVDSNGAAVVLPEPGTIGMLLVALGLASFKRVRK
jgi:hypothetical protein